MTDTATTPPPDPTTTVVEGTGTVTTTTSPHAEAVNDTITVRFVVILIGFIVLSVIIGTVVLVLNGKNMPTEILTLGSVGLGALGAMLASTASKRT